MVKLNAATERIMNIFTLHINFILLMILKSNFLIETENIIISLCALLIGNLLPTISMLFFLTGRFSDFVTYH